MERRKKVVVIELNRRSTILCPRPGYLWPYGDKGVASDLCIIMQAINALDTSDKAPLHAAAILEKQ